MDSRREGLLKVSKEGCGWRARIETVPRISGEKSHRGKTVGGHRQAPIISLVAFRRAWVGVEIENDGKLAGGSPRLADKEIEGIRRPPHHLPAFASERHFGIVVLLAQNRSKREEGAAI